MNSISNSYGFARALLAFNTLLTLIINPIDLLFKQAQGRHDGSTMSLPIENFNLFNILGLTYGKIIAIAILLIVIIGYMPRVTGILHWWVNISFYAGATIIDGGDQAAAAITLLLIPITLIDTRRNHWQRGALSLGQYQKVIVTTTLTIIRMQVSLIYLEAFIGKLFVSQWLDGTAMYYFYSDPVFGINYPWLKAVLRPLMYNGLAVFLITWLPLFLELALAYALVISPRYRKPLLLLGVFFHFLTALLFGLVSFFLSMTGVLFLYLWPLDERIVFDKPNLRVLKRYTSKYTI